MSNNNVVLLAALAAVALVVIKKQQSVQTVSGKPVVSSQTGSRNMNGDYFAALLGPAWKSLLASSAVKGSANGTPFIMGDGYGGLFTSDGTPVYSGDVGQDFTVGNTGLPALYADPAAEYGTGAWVSGANPASTSAWADSVGGWYGSNGNTGLSSVLNMFEY